MIKTYKTNKTKEINKGGYLLFFSNQASLASLASLAFLHIDKSSHFYIQNKTHCEVVGQEGGASIAEER